MTTWRERAEEVIREQIAIGRAQDLDDAQILRLVDAAYPFGQRKYWPYKAWLAARRSLLALPGSTESHERARLRAWNAAVPIVDSGVPETPLEALARGESEE
jgi:hypothetical protein